MLRASHLCALAFVSVPCRHDTTHEQEHHISAVRSDRNIIFGVRKARLCGNGSQHMCKKYSLGNEVRVSKANQYFLDVDSVKQVEHIVAAMEAAGGREVTRPVAKLEEFASYLDLHPRGA